MDLGPQLLKLQSELRDKQYRPGGYQTFMVHEPKRRMISRAPFRDRIVHHCLINVIGPIFKKSFVAQSYANQVGKGTHRAIRDVHNAMRRNSFVMHCDIKKYFPSIDHEILKQQLRAKIKDRDVLWLIELIINGSNPQEPVMNYFPGDDLLTPLMRRKGMPIGNLTSQFFANVYLNGLDHFVKEQLRCRYYARYVDDMVIVGRDKYQLWHYCGEIEHYLEKLRLRLHPRKKRVLPVDHGFSFLGQVLTPSCRRLPKPNIRRFMRRMRKYQQLVGVGKMSTLEYNQCLQSWLGHAKQAHTNALRHELLLKLSVTSNTVTEM
jgi:retron-type reverse transcriptase